MFQSRIKFVLTIGSRTLKPIQFEMEFVLLSPQHSDIVTDISFDFYGKRFATCSVVRNIKIWTLVKAANSTIDSKSSERWDCYDIPAAHMDSIWRLSWSHPEFGSLLASCSEDRTVSIWEEQENISSTGKGSRDRWIRKATLSDSKRPINDVKFAPKHLGLKFASASADGSVRIYEASDLFSLSYWQLLDTLDIETGGGKDINSARVSEHGLTSLSWCDSPFESPRIAAGGYSKQAVVWVKVGKEWHLESVLGNHGDTVHDVAWAPNMGRSYHLIATASREPTFQVHTLKRCDDKLEYTSSAVINSVNCSPVWRIAWNATGTILAASSEDGTLTLYRRNFSGTWINIQSLPADADQFRSFYK